MRKKGVRQYRTFGPQLSMQHHSIVIMNKKDSLHRMGGRGLRAGNLRVRAKTLPKLKEKQLFLQRLEAICRVPVGTRASREI